MLKLLLRTGVSSKSGCCCIVIGHYGYKSSFGANQRNLSNKFPAVFFCKYIFNGKVQTFTPYFNSSDRAGNVHSSSWRVLLYLGDGELMHQNVVVVFVSSLVRPKTRMQILETSANYNLEKLMMMMIMIMVMIIMEMVDVYSDGTHKL